LLDLQSSDFEGLDKGITGAVRVETGGQDNKVVDKEVEAPASLASPASPASPTPPALQLRLKKARKALARYQG